jgi:hypothetical protein
MIIFATMSSTKAKSHRHWRFRIHRQLKWLMTTENGETTRYYYDGDVVIAEAIVAGGVAELKALYIRGLGLVAREDETDTKAYYLRARGCRGAAGRNRHTRTTPQDASLCGRYFGVFCDLYNSYVDRSDNNMDCDVNSTYSGPERE